MHIALTERAPSGTTSPPSLREEKRRLEAALDWQRRMSNVGASALDRERAEEARRITERRLAEVTERVTRQNVFWFQLAFTLIGAFTVGAVLLAIAAPFVAK